jgi:class 3 adenylate cyclase
LGDAKWRALLEDHNRLVRHELDRFDGREVNTTGDGFLAIFDSPTRAVCCAHEVIRATPALGMQLRAGIHTGECERTANSLGGIAVHLAARVSAMADRGEVLVSHTVKDLTIGSGIQFRDRGEYELKGVPGAWRLFAAEAEAGADPAR